MRTTINFDKWLEENVPNGFGRFAELSLAMVILSDTPRYSIWRRGGKTFVQGPGRTLVLVSEKATQAFSRIVKQKDSDDVIDGKWLRQMRKLERKNKQ